MSGPGPAAGPPDAETGPGGASPARGPGGGPLTERQTYRRRRLMDFARFLPVLGALLFAVPLLWPDPDPYPAPDVPAGMPMSAAITYVFVVWAGLIAAGFGFGLAVKFWADHWTGGGPDGTPEGEGGEAADEPAAQGLGGGALPRRRTGGGLSNAQAATMDARPEGFEAPVLPGRAGAAH